MKKKNTITIIIFSCFSLIILGGALGFYFGQISNTATESAGSSTFFHYPELGQKDYYDEMFVDIADCADNYQPSIKGVLVNHHLLAGKLMAQAFCAVATDRALTVLIIAPDHFSAGSGLISAPENSWQTPYGRLDINLEIIRRLANSNAVTIDDAPFDKEHGIFNLVPFIRRALPNAKIVPLIVKENIFAAGRDQLVEALLSLPDEDLLIVASLDFSHYLTSAKADAADAVTMEVVKNLDFEAVPSLNPGNRPDNVDSQPGLEIFLKYLSVKRADSFELLAHSNSAKLIGDESLVETTSYITGVFRTEDSR